MVQTVLKQEEKKPLSLKTSFFRAMVQHLKPGRLGDMLVTSGLITEAQLKQALAEQRKCSEQLGKILVRQGFVTPLQLYQKLAEQWCVRASITGMAIFMQVVEPTAALAQQATVRSDSNISAQFTLAAATIPSGYMPTRKSTNYPELFGTHEVRSNDISAFKKWTTVMRRFEDQMKTKSGSSPRIMAWKNEIEQLRDKSVREQIDGVNRFTNSVRYIEDRDNYGMSDYWATPIEFFSKGGDCEDYAIAKYASLRALGFSPDQLRIAIVKDTIRNLAHAILIVYTDEGSFVLDNQDKQVEYAADVSRYKPIFSINSTSWWLHQA